MIKIMHVKRLPLFLALILAAPALHAADDARTTGLEEAFAGLAVDAEEEVATLEPAEQRLVKCTEIVLDALAAKRKLTLPNLRRVFISFRDALVRFAEVKPLPAIPRTTTIPLLRQANDLWSRIDQASLFDLFDDSVLDKMKENITRALARGIQPCTNCHKDCTFVLLMQVTHVLIWDAFNKASTGSLTDQDHNLLEAAFAPISALLHDIHPPVSSVVIMTNMGPAHLLPDGRIMLGCSIQ